MDLFEAVYSRRAVRGFTEEAVNKGILNKLIDAAIQAPSAMNQQRWSFTIIRKHDLLEQISTKSKIHMLRTSSVGLASHHFLDILEDKNFNIFYGAPVLIVIGGPTDNSWTNTDCSLAAENLMLAACALGLGTCWIGFAQGWLATTEGKHAIGLESDQIAVAPIIVGHPKAEAPRIARHAPNVRWIDN